MPRRRLTQQARRQEAERRQFFLVNVVHESEDKMPTTVEPLQSPEELERALNGVAFNLDGRERSHFHVDLGGILVTIDQEPLPHDSVSVQLAVENQTEIFYDAGMFTRITEGYSRRLTAVSFRPSSRERFEVSYELPRGVWQLSLWEQ